MAEMWLCGSRAHPAHPRRAHPLGFDASPTRLIPSREDTNDSEFILPPPSPPLLYKKGNPASNNKYIRSSRIDRSVGCCCCFGFGFLGILLGATMGGGKDNHNESDKGLFSSMMHGSGGGYGYPPQGYPPHGYPPPAPGGAYPPPPGAYAPQYGYGYPPQHGYGCPPTGGYPPPHGGYPPTGYPGSSVPYQGYGSSHGGGHMGAPLLAGGAAAAAAAYGAHRLSHGGHGGHMGYGGYGGHGHYGHHHGKHGYYGHHHHGKHGRHGMFGGGKFKRWK